MGFTTLHSFTALAYDPTINARLNSDGAAPVAGLVLSGNTLYGTAQFGGMSGNGTVFAVNTNGTGFANLHSFTAVGDNILGGYNYYTNSDGDSPVAGLALWGNMLYGTAQGGGNGGSGTVFAVNTDGSDFTNLYNFTALDQTYHTNSDGRVPQSLILSDNTLYGTASGGGSSGSGTVFKVNTDGTGFTVLHSFTAIAGPLSTNGDGANPHAILLLSGSTLYGTAAGGGSSGSGTVFAVNTDGTGFSTLHVFSATGTNSSGFLTYSDGGEPGAELILMNNTLYGTAAYGGSSGGAPCSVFHWGQPARRN